MMRKCPSCQGTIDSADYERCPECGAPFHDQDFLHREASFRKKCEQDPLNTEPYLQLADFYIQHKMPRAAEIEFLKVMNLDENYPGLYEKLARVCSDQGHHDAALQFLQSALAERPDDPELRALIAHVAERLQLWDQAIDNSSLVLALDPKNVDMLSVRANAMRAKGDSWGLVETLEKLWALKKDDSNLIVEIARLHEALGNRDMALVSWQHVLERDPEDRSAIRSLGKIHFARGEYASSIEYLLRSEVPSDPDLTAMLFVSYVRTGQIHLAESLIENFFYGPDRLLGRTREAMGRALFELGNAMRVIDRLHSAAHYFQMSLIFQKDPEVETGLETLRQEIRRQTILIAIKWATLALASMAAVFLIAFFTSGKLRVAGEPGVKIEVREGGDLLCSADGTDCRTGRLYIGPYWITAKKEGHTDFEEKFWALGGFERTVTPVFTAKFGSLEIRTRPAGAEVTVDERSVGKTPVTLEQVLARPTRLTIRKEGRITIEETVLPEEGKKITVERLLPRRFFADFQSPPAGLRYDDRLKLADGRLEASAMDASEGPGSASRAREAYLDKRLFRNFSASVKVKVMKETGAAPRPGTNAWNFGIRFRQTNTEYNKEEKSYRFVNGQAPGMLFGSMNNIYGQQGFYFAANDNEQWDVKSRFARDIDPGVWAKLTVKCLERICTFFVNDKEIGREGTSITEPGLVGLFAYPGRYDVSFGEFEVVEIPDEKNLAELED